MKIRITKYELYPNENPTHYDISFEVIANNGRLFYENTKVVIDTTKTDEEILQLAYDNLKYVIEPKVIDMEKKSPLLGKEFFIVNGKLENTL